jgi:hypothetical protein
MAIRTEIRRSRVAFSKIEIPREHEFGRKREAGDATSVAGARLAWRE